MFPTLKEEVDEMVSEKINKYRGSCFCGAVQYEVQTPIKFVAHDHCSICRKISGAPFVTWCGVKSDQFQLLNGKENLALFKSTKDAERQFCKVCGSHLFFRSSNWKNEVHFTRASIPGEIEEDPKAHVFFSDKENWYEVNDSLPKYGGKTGLEPLEA